METTLTMPLQKNKPQNNFFDTSSPVLLTSQKTGRIEKFFVSVAKQISLFYYACILIKQPSLILKTYRELMKLRNQTWGTQVNKMYKVDGRYYNNLYNPGWPSKSYNAFLKDELMRHAFPLDYTGRLSMVFFCNNTEMPFTLRTLL